MLYADGARIVSESTEGHDKIRTVIVTVFEAVSLTVSEKMERMLPPTLNQEQTSLAPPLVIAAASERYIQMTQVLYLGGIIHESADLSLETKRRIRLMLECL